MFLCVHILHVDICILAEQFFSLQGFAAQEPILQSARAMLDSSTSLLKTARSLVINPKDPPTWSVLAGHSHTVSNSIKSLIKDIR